MLQDMDFQQKTDAATKCACMANGAVLKQPGKDAKIIKGKELEREIAHLGLFMERYDVEDEDIQKPSWL